MNIKPIKTDSDYRAALAQIEALWDSKSGTRQAEELEVLATLVEVYEQEHEEIPPPDPIDAILFRLDKKERLGENCRMSLALVEGEYRRF